MTQGTLEVACTLPTGDKGPENGGTMAKKDRAQESAEGRLVVGRMRASRREIVVTERTYFEGDEPKNEKRGWSRGNEKARR